MRYGYQHAIFHFIKAVALFGVGLGITLATVAAFFQFESMDFDPETIQALGILFEVVSYSIVAIFAWSLVEFTAGVWSIPHVRRGAGWVRQRFGGAA